MGITVICRLKGKTCRKLANGQDIDYYEEKKWTPGNHLPLYWGFFSIICKHVYLYIQQISGECLQDHWSSGFIFAPKHRLWVLVRTTFALSKILKISMRFSMFTAKTIENPCILHVQVFVMRHDDTSHHQKF